MDSIQILRETREGLLQFIDDLRVVLPDEQDFIWFQVYIRNQVPMVDVMNYIVKNIVPLEKKVLERDAEYFKKNAVLFEKLGQFESNVNRFKTLWDKNQNEEEREMVWKWLEYFIQLGKKYKEYSVNKL